MRVTVNAVPSVPLRNVAMGQFFIFAQDYAEQGNQAPLYMKEGYYPNTTGYKGNTERVVRLFTSSGSASSETADRDLACIPVVVTDLVVDFDWAKIVTVASANR